MKFFTCVIFIILLAAVFVVQNLNYQQVETPLEMGKNLSASGTSDFYAYSFPPVTNHKQRMFTKKLLDDTNIRKVRFETKWKDREPSKGKYNWGPLDERIEFLKNNNTSILLTIANDIPKWACKRLDSNSCYTENTENFEEFIDALLSHYQGSIDIIQFGNEWDNPGNHPADIEHFVRYNNILYNSTKEHSPKTRVVLGGITRTPLIYEHICMNEQLLDFSNTIFTDNNDPAKLQEYFYEKGCVKQKTKYQSIYDRVQFVFQNALYDLVDIHLYDDAENWASYLAIASKYSPKDIIVSEFGGVNPDYEIYNESYHAGRVQKYLDVIDTLPIVEAYYFKPVDDNNSIHKESGLLIDDGSRKKAAYEVFKNHVTQ